MSLKRRMTLAAPLVDADGFTDLRSFELDYLYVQSDRLDARLRPSGAGATAIYPAGSVDVNGALIVASKNTIILNAAQTTKVQNFIQAIEDAIKANLDTVWP